MRERWQVRRASTIDSCLYKLPKLLSDVRSQDGG